MNVSNFKIICSDDKYLVDYLIKKEYPDITKYAYIEDPFSNRALFTGKSFLLNSSDKCCYICKDASVFNTNESYWGSLVSGSFCRNSVLILVVDKLDSRTKFAKQCKSCTLVPDVSKLNIADVIPLVKTLTKPQYTELFKNCGSSFTLLNYELDKIKHFAESTNSSMTDAYNMLINENILAKNINDNIFELVEDIIFKNSSSVYKKLHILGKTEFDFGLLVNLYNTFRNLYIYEECFATNTLNNSGLTPFNIKISAKFHNLYTKKQLLSILRFLQKIDSGIKQGTLSTDYALDYMIAGVLSS